MELHLATMNGFFPQTGSAEDWNAAYYRLEDYLRAHAVVHKIYQSQIILRLLQRAAARHRDDPAQVPTQLALEEAYAEMERWFQRIFPNDELPPARLSSLGRVSLHILNAAERWPDVFLAEGELPEDFIQAMRQTLLQSGPDLRVSTMVPRSPDVPPASERLENTLRNLDRILFAGSIGALLLCGSGL